MGCVHINYRLTKEQYKCKMGGRTCVWGQSTIRKFARLHRVKWNPISLTPEEDLVKSFYFGDSILTFALPRIKKST